MSVFCRRHSVITKSKNKISATAQFKKPNAFEKALSFVWDVTVLKTSSELHPILDLKMVNGVFQLNTGTATYSYGKNYYAFNQGFELIDVKKNQPQNILVLGGGLGSVCEILTNKYGVRANFKLIEHDPVIIDLAKQVIPKEIAPSIQFVAEDALDFLLNTDQCFDLIIVDLFKDLEVPQKFLEQNFLIQLRNRLSKGYLLFNTITSSPIMEAKSNNFFQDTFSKVFSETQKLDLKGNSIFSAFHV